jgi:Fe2+ transport system protein FeoA
MGIGAGRHSQHARGRGRHRFGRTSEEPGTLAALRPGDDAVIESIACATARAHALRFGMGEGAAVSCVTVVPAGPVVLRSGRQEIAVGRGLARRIRVRGRVA